jgi:GTPase Era involved in 16S rRNA processing
MKTTEKAIVYDKIVTIQSSTIKLLDTGGQHKYNEDKFGWLGHELETYNIDGIVVVCDLTEPNSQMNSMKYFDFIKKYTTTIPIILLNNKSDKIKSDNDFNNFENVSLLHTFTNSRIFFTSARMGAEEGNIEKAFITLIDLINKQNQTRKRSREEYPEQFNSVFKVSEPTNKPSWFSKPKETYRSFTSTFIK